MRELSKAELVVLGFTLGYMAIWPVGSLVLDNDEFLYYFVVMCFLVVGVGAVYLCVFDFLLLHFGDCRSGG